MSATKPATLGGPYTVPPEPNRVPAIALAVAVHALLLAFLWIGISWQNTEPPAVEAEVWDMKVQSAAAPALPPPPPPEVVEPEPAPQPKPIPAPPPPPKVAEPEPVKPAAPDINLEREKKLAEQKKQRERDLLEKKERERELAEKKEREELKAKELAEKKAQEKKELAKKEEQEKKELEKKKLESEKKLAAEKAEKAEAEKKKLADKAAKEKAEKAEQAKLDKLRDLELKRITGAAGTSGSAQKSSAPKTDAGYQAKIAAKVKSNTSFTGSTDVPGNPKATFRVEQLPTGEILSVRLTKSSGVPQFDDAVERGINKSSPLPPKNDGTVERTIVVNFSMKDLN
jgi:colicin import membrane protein